MRSSIVGLACSSLAALVFGWSSAVAAADAVIGSVLAARGEVFADAGKGRQPLTVNLPLRVGDTIISGAGKAKIALNDGTILSVGENSRLRLAEYERSPGYVNARLNLISGALRLVVDKMAPAGRFEVETETAIAAVRGTDWFAEVTPEQTSVAVVSGIVVVSGRAADAKSTVVLEGKGQGTDVRPGAAPTPPRAWSAQRFADTLARASFE